MREGYGSGPSAGAAVLKADLNNVEDMNASLGTFFVFLGEKSLTYFILIDVTCYK